MNTVAKDKMGTIKVQIDSDSAYFRGNVPLEVRDNHMRLVQKSDDVRSFELEPGIYQISAVLEDGQEHKHFIKVQSGETTTVKMGANTESIKRQEIRRRKQRKAFKKYRSRYTKTMEVIVSEDTTDYGTESAEIDALVKLLGAERLDDRRNPWMIACSSNVESVATAEVDVGDDRYCISLPTSPHDSPGYNSCVVTIEEIYSRPHVVAWISPQRVVANAIQNMMASNELHSARRMAKEATELLRAKYRDPTGATLGALVLHKFGLLYDKISWLENLTRDFDWIPDGKILLAATLLKQESVSMEDAQRAFELAVKASEQRILYTECFSILLDLLRRWPIKEMEPDIRKQAIARLAYQSPDIDWHSICMSLKMET